MKKATSLAYLCRTLFSCSSVEKKAGEGLQTARAALERGDYSEAKMQTDSIRILYPKAPGIRYGDIGLTQQVGLKEREKTLTYLDSMLQEKREVIDTIKGSYALEKDAEYQRIGNYLHPSQMTKKNLHHSYLCPQTDENGVMSITSIYCDPHNIYHLTVRVTAPDGSSVETPAPRNSYETTDLGEKIEEADYKVGEDNNIIAFLNLNKDKDIRVNYLGERSYATIMTPNDRKAVVVVYELAQLPSAIIEIKKNKDEANLKIEFVERKMVEREGGEKGQVLECRPSALPL